MNEIWALITLTLLFANIDTGGGHVGGDAKTGRDFSGRDRSEINITNNPGRRDDGPDEDEDRAEWKTLIYGSQRMNYPGILNRLKALEGENTLFRIGGAVMLILIASLIIALAIAIRAWGG